MPRRFRSYVFFAAYCAMTLGLKGQPVCASCHPREAANYARTAMAQSLGTPEDQPGGSVKHKLSGSTVAIRNENHGMVHSLAEAGLTASYPVSYYVGAGKVGRSYLVRIGDYLFQSPVSYYTERHGWDLTPGYETEHRLDFTHQIVSGCLFCHTGEVRLKAGTNNRYEDIPFTPISCERCHGSGAEHARQPSAKNIVNPAKLAARARDSVCEQCHLEGAIRILNPGKDWWDFHAGGELEPVFAVYLEANGAGGFKAVSQVEQLAQSKCAQKSGGQLWCATCHDPHGEPAANRNLQVKRICQGCHAELSAASHPAGIAECTSCHMTARAASNVAHASVTDHRIRRRPGLDFRDVEAEPRAPVAWREPAAALRDRDLALAELAIARSERSNQLARDAFRLLTGLLNPLPRDPEALSALASMMLQKRPDYALRLYLSVSQMEPGNGSHALDTGVAYEAAGDFSNAVKSFEAAIRMDPSLERAYLELAKVYRQLGREGTRTQVIRRYLELFPESIDGRLALRE